MQMLNINSSKPDFIQELNPTYKETVSQFIEMIDFLEKRYNEEFKLILEHIIYITQEEVDSLTFNEDQFKNLLCFYVEDRSVYLETQRSLNIEEQIVGHYTGYEDRSFPS